MHKSKHFTYVTSFDSHMNPIKFYYYLHFTYEETDAQRQNKLYAQCPIGKWWSWDLDSCSLTQDHVLDHCYASSLWPEICKGLENINLAIHSLCHLSVLVWPRQCHVFAHPLPFSSWMHRPHIPALLLGFGHVTEYQPIETNRTKPPPGVGFTPLPTIHLFSLARSQMQRSQRRSPQFRNQLSSRGKEHQFPNHCMKEGTLLPSLHWPTVDSDESKTLAFEGREGAIMKILRLSVTAASMTSRMISTLKTQGNNFTKD